MTRPSVGCLVCAVGALLVVGSSGYAQSNAAAADQQVQAVEKEAIAASILAREEAASGRTFDPVFRAEAVKRLASRSQAELEAIQSQDGGIGTSAYGDSAADMTYVPVAPCRIIDTRVAGGQIGAGATRDFWVTGTGFTSQGGVAGSCGVPLGPATAVVINFVAVNPAGAGDLRITPFGTAMPTASFLNYALPGTGFNVANALVAKICNPATTSCGKDFTLQADAAAVHVVADVMGYFEAAPPAGRAWASVQRSTTLEAARTKNFTSVTHPSTGVWCLQPASTVSLANVTPQVTVEWGCSSGFDLLAFPVTDPLPFTPCTGTQLQVRTYQLPSGVATLSDNVCFFVWVP